MIIVIELVGIVVLIILFWVGVKVSVEWFAKRWNVEESEDASTKSGTDEQHLS